MAKPDQPELFFHLGLPKTASTFLQVKVFPRLAGITYFRKKHFNQFASIIAAGAHPRYLFSCEFDRELEAKMELIARDFPQAKILLVFRRHDQWIASKYKYYLRKHGHKSFAEFVDIDSETGEWGRTDLLYRPKIEKAQSLFAHPPLVLNFEELQQNPALFTQRLEAYLGCHIETFRNGVVKQAFSPKQLWVVRKLNRSYRYHKLTSSSRSRNRVHYKYREFLLHTVAFLAQFWPGKVVKEDVVQAAELAHIRDAFADDWAYVLTQAAAQSTVSP